VADDPGFARVDLLRRLGLVESALEELEEVVERATGDTVRLYGFSSAYVRDERYHMALRIFRRHFAALAASGDPALPRAFWEMLYPYGWRTDVTAAAQENAKAVNAAQLFEIDDVIDPAETRGLIAATFAAATGREQPTHGHRFVDTW